MAKEPAYNRNVSQDRYFCIDIARVVFDQSADDDAFAVAQDRLGQDSLLGRDRLTVAINAEDVFQNGLGVECHLVFG